MKKIVNILIITIILLMTGCFSKDNNIDKIYLDNKFYQGNKFIPISKEQLESLKNINSTYVLFVYNNFCTMDIPCDKIFEEFMKKNNISIYSISFKEFKETYLYSQIKYVPTVIIIQNGDIIDYLDANSNEDYECYQNVNSFTQWINKYIYLQ